MAVIAGVEEKTETEWAASEPQSSKLRDAAAVDGMSGTFTCRGLQHLHTLLSRIKLRGSNGKSPI